MACDFRDQVIEGISTFAFISGSLAWGKASHHVLRTFEQLLRETFSHHQHQFASHVHGPPWKWIHPLQSNPCLQPQSTSDFNLVSDPEPELLSQAGLLNSCPAETVSIVKCYGSLGYGLICYAATDNSDTSSTKCTRTVESAPLNF